MSLDPLDDADLPELVAVAMEMRDSGIEPPLEEICRERPDLVDSVAQALATSRRIPVLQREVATYDGLSGRVLDARYRLVARLGAGAMGVVYRGEDLELQRPVAIKILRAALLDGKQAESRFAREAEVLAAIQHTSVVTVHDRGRTEDGDPYLVMELLEGTSLSALLESGEEPGDLRTVLRWTAGLANGLAAAHAKGIFHRDVKPSNIFVRRDGTPVLLDFGIAALDDHATITREGTAIGTPAYMAPESLSERSRPSTALDVYGLIATLYHVLTSRPPYTGTPSQIISKLATKDPPHARRIRHDLPRDLQAILDHGMARHPSDRYASAAELEADLRAFLDHRPVAARPLSGVARVWRRLRRSHAFRAGAAVGVLAIASVVVTQWHAYRTERRREARLELWSHVPPNLTVAAPENRRLSDAEGPDDVAALLDAAAATGVDVLPTLLVRASFRLDHGDVRGAARDMGRVADSVGSAYASALARHYADLDPDASSALELDLAGLPQPEGAMDAYLTAFHAIRVGRHADARPLLEDERLAEFLPAQELLVLLLTGDPHRMYERAVWLEEETGRRTATTAHRLGTALALQMRYDTALEVSRDGLELAPLSNALHINAGVAAWRLGRLAEAREHFDTAIELKPSFPKPYELLVRVLMDAREPDEAHAVLGTAPLGANDAAQRKRLSLAGEIETVRALMHWDAGEDELSLAAAEEALARFHEAAAYGRPVQLSRVAISAGILEGDAGAVTRALLALLIKDPLKWRRIETLCKWMPADLDPHESASVREYLDVLRRTFAALAFSDSTLSSRGHVR